MPAEITDVTPQRQHLLFISTKTTWGGSEPLWCNTAEVALRQQQRVTVVLPFPAVLQPAHRKLEELGAKLLIRPERSAPSLAARLRRKLCGIKSDWETKWWQNQFRELPDAVCISQGSAYCGLKIPGLADWLKESRLRYVVICQSTRVPLVPDEVYAGKIKDYYSHAVHVGFTARGNQQEVEVNLAWNIPNAFIHQNPMDFPTENAVEWIDSAMPLISCPSRLFVRDKGQDILLQVLAGQPWKERDFKLQLFGSGPDETYLRELALYLGVDKKVIFCGQTEGMLPIWKRTELMVLPSRSEGLPLVLVGAMAAGRPCMVTDVGGNAEWIRDNIDGFVARMPNVLSVGEALESAWQNRHRWKEMGKAARETYLAKQNPDPAGTLLALLRDAAERGKKSEKRKS